jgi:hypothetical protein
MFVLGHMGVGGTMAAPLARRLAWRLVLVGTLLPDLVDKPLYYGLSLATGREGAALGFICGTRTVGHTALLVLLLGSAAAFSRSPALRALALGMATHTPVDILAEMVGGEPGRSALVAWLFPLLGPHFAVSPFHDPWEHLGVLKHLDTILGEALGATLLLWQLRRRAAAPRLATPS